MSCFAAGGNSWDYFGRKKGLKFGSGRGQSCQVSDVLFSAFGLIEELKNPCGCRGFRDWLGYSGRATQLTFFF